MQFVRFRSYIGDCTKGYRFGDPKCGLLLLGHAKLESTVRYLGIEFDDGPEMAEQTEV
jgi:hypothetical protein